MPKVAGLRQLDVYASVGVKPEHLVVGHTCCRICTTVSVRVESDMNGRRVG